MPQAVVGLTGFAAPIGTDYNRQRTTMRTPVIITTPYPTIEETARLGNVPPERVKEILKMVDEIVARDEARRAAKKSRATKKRAAKPKRSKKQ